MTTEETYEQADPQIVETWLKGWSLARELPPPIADHGGLRVDVGWPDQQKRYVFSALGPGLFHFANTIFQPAVFLKVCAPASLVRPVLPPRWEIQRPGFMMTCSLPVHPPGVRLPEGYTLTVTTTSAGPAATIYTADGETAASGLLAIVDDYTIYDRIATTPAHQRRGLGSAVMNALTMEAVSRGFKKGILVATPAGKALYETLGWKLYSLYTTAVIPQP
ncbi:GNAT family N-acetyltransferase [Chitinophaga varians]|uniref:GNAT family N-acetyltransferase n=1 Tax=Chitinophaga varians TaxID=2202339 RepID=A0A847RAL2_9BACT|nr:GNAT family N-acetyltransferase [Chitinophaga varians]NLR63110.1 GNAT family N-acetyltransferase [Chitinophaga varians]